MAAELPDLIKAEPRADLRQQHIRRVLSDRRIWSGLLDNDHAEVIYAVAKLETDKDYLKTQLRLLLYSPSGLLAYHLRRGEQGRVLQLLKDEAYDDLGRQRFASFLLLTDRIDQQIELLRKDESDARLLVYLLRAKGDLEEARDIAVELNDAGLLKAIAAEQRDWEGAAKLQASGPCPLPIPVSTKVRSEPVDRVEQLGFLAAYQRLAGQADDFDETIQKIKQLGGDFPDDINLQWFCAEAILLNDRPLIALEMLEKTHPLRAFDFYNFRGDYAKALEIANWQAESKLDRAWIDSLPAKKSDATTQTMGRFDLALRTARLLHALGRNENAAQIVSVLEPFADEQPTTNSSSAPRRQCWERICRAYLWMGRKDRAWEAAAKTLLEGSSGTPVIFSRIDYPHVRECQGWWAYFRARYPAEPGCANVCTRAYGYSRGSSRRCFRIYAACCRGGEVFRDVDGHASRTSSSSSWANGEASRPT